MRGRVLSSRSSKPTLNHTSIAHEIASNSSSKLPHMSDDGAGGDSSRSRTQSFVDRMDQAVTEFLQKSKSQIAVNTPQSIESNFRYFQQRLKERMGTKTPGVHVTSQPEVDEAAKEVQSMHAYFDELGKLVEKQLFQLRVLNETEQELALFFQQKGYQESIEEISAMSIDIGKAYSDGVKTRASIITAVDGFNEFAKTFKDKAIQDSIDTMKRQENSRIEFDGFAAKLEYLQRPANVTILGKEHVNSDPAVQSATDREVEHARTQFTAAKARYQNLSTAIIDKAVLLEMKRDVDYRVQLERLMRVRGAIAGRGGSGGGSSTSGGSAGGVPSVVSGRTSVLGSGRDTPELIGGGGGVLADGVGMSSVTSGTAALSLNGGGGTSNGVHHETVDLYSASPFSQPAAYQVPMSD
ncbi:Arfaptin-like domain-containing protein [Zopfochytrium polystomum]|nr:Arfaptin-like domain-containing protein [Zopfochytrium polystomum]